MELIKEYYVTIRYHSRKANVLADFLCWKVISMRSLAILSETKRHFAKEIEDLNSKFVQLVISARGALLSSIKAKSMFIEKIKAT